MVDYQRELGGDDVYVPTSTPDIEGLRQDVEEGYDNNLEEDPIGLGEEPETPLDDVRETVDRIERRDF